MITCESACPHRIPKENTASPATGLRWPQSPTSIGTPVFVYSAQAIRDAYTGIDGRLPAIRTPSTTRSRPTPRWRCCACCASSAAAPTPTPAARFASRSAPASRPADIVFTGVGKTREELEFAVAAGRGHDQRRVAGRARSHRRGRRGRSGARRAWRCASIPTSTPRPTRTSPPACASTSSASRSRRRAAIYRDAARPAGAALRRRARPHRLADHQRRAAAARGRGAGRHRPASCATTACRSSTWTWAAASAFPTKASR